MKNVLFIGPKYKNHRGGIGAVLEVYAANIKTFKFIPTYSGKSIVKGFFIYLRAVVLLCKVLITDRQVKIVHIHSASRGSFIRKSLLVLISKLFGKKVVFHVHGAEFHLFYENSGWMRGYIRFILQRVDILVCLSIKWKNYFEENFRIKNVSIINNVIKKADPPPVFTTPNGRVHFLFLGIIGERKGLFDLIEVLNKNKHIYKDRYTLTVGGNGKIEKLKSVISNNNQENEITYAGWVSGEKKNQLLRNCDVYVLPSYNEGLPISVLEALSFGKPIISTTVGGIPEIVKPGYNGWLLNAGDHQALQNIITEILNDKTVLEVYGRNSLNISGKYTPESVFSSLEILYDQLLRKN